jgi:hypothetical protein
VCRPCTERSLTGHDPRDREPAALNRRTAGYGGISRRKEDHRRGTPFHTGSSSLTSNQREDCLRAALTAQPQEMFGATRLRFAEGDATREWKLP